MATGCSGMPCGPAGSGSGAGRPRPAADWFLDQGTSSTPSSTASSRRRRGRPRAAAGLDAVVSRARRLGHLQAVRPARARRHPPDPALCFTLAWATAIGGDTPGWAGGSTRRGRVTRTAAGMARPEWRVGDAAHGAAPRRGRRRAGAGLCRGRLARETDPALLGYSMARHLLGTSYLAADRPSRSGARVDRRLARRPVARRPLRCSACRLRAAWRWRSSTPATSSSPQVCVENAPSVAAVATAWATPPLWGSPAAQVEGRLAPGTRCPRAHRRTLDARS